MGLDLGRRGDYALRAMVELARRYGRGLLKAREVAAATGVPGTYLAQVLADLVRAKLVVSVAGPRGGYATARAPAEISLLEVVEAVNGPLRSASCPLRGGPCTPDDPCGLHSAWGRAQDALAANLAGTTLEAVIT